MKDTLSFIVNKLVDHPEDIIIEERQEGDATIFVIGAHPEDIGKIIGKSGRIIRAIRDLMKVLAAKTNRFVDVEIANDGLRAPEASA